MGFCYGMDFNFFRLLIERRAQRIITIYHQSGLKVNESSAGGGAVVVGKGTL